MNLERAVYVVVVVIALLIGLLVVLRLLDRL
jgi:hypothetical protein